MRIYRPRGSMQWRLAIGGTTLALTACCCGLMLLTPGRQPSDAGRTTLPARPVDTVEVTATPLPLTATMTLEPPTATVEVTATPLPPTATAVPTRAPTPTPVSSALIARAANIRSGPGTGYAVIGSLEAADRVVIEGRNDDGDWYRLAGYGGEAWVSGSLVLDPPGGLPVYPAPSLPMATPVPARSNPVVIPPATTGCDCSGDIYNCSSFGSWSDAQGCFAYCLQTTGYDVHRLDQNNDGVACESMR